MESTELEILPKSSTLANGETNGATSTSPDQADATVPMSTIAEHPSQRQDDERIVPGNSIEKSRALPNHALASQQTGGREQVEDFLEDNPAQQSVNSTLDSLGGDIIIDIDENGIETGSVTSQNTTSAAAAPPRPRLYQRRHGDPMDVTETNSRKPENIPNGYPRLATFLDSNDAFMAFRRFGNLQSRLLLEKQSLLTQLEKEIDDLDWDIFEENPDILRCDATEEIVNSDPAIAETVQEHRKLLMKAEESFREYAALMTAVQQMRCFEPPTERDYISIRRYLHNTKPLMDAEMDSFRAKHDLVALRPPTEPDYLEHKIIQFLSVLGAKCQQIFLMRQRPFTRIIGNGTYGLFGRTSSVANIATAIVAFFMTVLLVLPVLICYILVVNVGGSKGYSACIGVLFLFTLIFSYAMAFYSKAKRHEVLAATAAYCAVIVVFLGNAAGN
ncbi:hypothetical protein BDV96DRAFT_685420 [Lophiotrema nucula]|uniref:DUF6594 domain-containing protein n=1 Tax=Lophiotrema nucula TaxID=690887 RepID=A0A6A5ZE11_9PLEO|nr:hypothetical protein BDV96DRAFT_685420 [Lophiotrema nucula]